MSLKRKAEAGAVNGVKKPKGNGTLESFFGPPKTVSSSAKVNGTSIETIDATPSKFDKEKWVGKLTEEQRELLNLEIETLHESWLSQLKEEVLSKEFLELKRFLKKELDAKKTIFPPLEDVYSWSRHTPLNTVKAVIIGQDPYHNFNQAHGLCFSVRPPTPAPPSLKNMYTCLQNDYPSFTAPPNRGGLLTPWADRGVLLLNTCLTVRAHEANSHANRGWERFTQKVIDVVAKSRARGVVFLAWGTPAAKRVAKVDRTRHLVLTSVHPSPLSAARGFFTCGHFKKTNEWLGQRYGEDGAIDWNLGVKAVEAGI
ncbi:MAG: uracil DNA glycosylase [Claussenomyces sp. TS43310]|nr:MAG: uracil DNA glycosylase [Claussenomyces sp. TS43310]